MGFVDFAHWDGFSDKIFAKLFHGWQGYPELFGHSSDVARLMWVIALTRRGVVASNFHYSLPHQPGLRSAHALATLISADVDITDPEAVENARDNALDPVEAGERWLRRLRSKVASGEIDPAPLCEGGPDMQKLISALLSFLPGRPGRPTRNSN